MEDQDFLKEISGLQEENKSLRVAVEELSILNDIATAITSTQELEQIVDLIVQKCVKHLKVEQGAVMLLDEKDRENPFRTMVRKQDTVANVLPYRLDTQITGWMIKNKAPLLINDFRNDDRFNWLAQKDVSVRSLLSVPMLLKGKMIGLIGVFNKSHKIGFSNDDQRLLSIIAAQSAHVIENARLYKEEQDLFRLQEEMRLAKDIQINLLPNNAPLVNGYDISGISIPAKEVGGDYFDYLLLDEGYLAFCLGDVSGKGMPAALLMANLQATLRGQININIPCNICVERSNNLLFQSTDPKKFVTLFYGILNCEKHELCYCNAGHDNPFLLVKGKDPIRLKTGGIVLGFIPEFTFSQEKVALDPGSVLLLYSDGITEAMNDREEEFGEEKLANIIMENLDDSAEKIIGKVLNAVQGHVGQTPQMDDMTMVVIKKEK